MTDWQSTDPPPRTQIVMVRVAQVIGVLVAVAVVLAILNLVSIFLTRGVTRGPESHRGVGQAIEFVDLKPLTGNPPPLGAADLKGHVTLLNFWGVWCPPCRTELPHMDELYRRFADQRDFRLAAISYPPGGMGGELKTLRDQTAALLKQSDLDLATYHDPGGQTLAAVDRVIGFQGFPTTLLLDRQGVLRAVWVGYQPGTETEIGNFIEKELLKTGEKQK
jgi:thiol-disulfide isomerase/thioredoxin